MWFHDRTVASPAIGRRVVVGECRFSSTRFLCSARDPGTPPPRPARSAARPSGKQGSARRASSFTSVLRGEPVASVSSLSGPRMKRASISRCPASGCSSRRRSGHSSAWRSSSRTAVRSSTRRNVSGCGGTNFDALKFRSMRTDAEHGVGAVQAIEDDPRVTRVGRLMRKTAMDELPQLWNIFRGDMSFVGPRALRPGEVEVSTAADAAVQTRSIDSRLCRAHRGPSRADRHRRRSTRRAMCRAGRSSATTASTCAGSRCRLDLRLILLSFWISVLGTWESRGRKY